MTVVPHRARRVLPRHRKSPLPGRSTPSKGYVTVTNIVHDPLDMLRQTLEDQFQRQTDQLGELTVRSRQPEHGGHDDKALAALIASCRQAIADTAGALRRMAEGTYGSCERCGFGIPAARLEIMPQARFCVPCQRILTG